MTSNQHKQLSCLILTGERIILQQYQFYYVSAPTNPPYPNAQNNIGVAIPVVTASVPPTTDLAGAIPVRVVSAPGVGPWVNDQGLNTGGIPVYESTAANAMPVWHP
jgi:hypothetical protein